MSDYLVAAFVGNAAEKWPQKIALIDHQGKLTFAELKTAVDDLAAQLTQQGLKPGMGLGVMARNGSGFVVAVFAGLACGATVMPLSHQLKKYEFEKQLVEAPLHAVLYDTHSQALIVKETQILKSNQEDFSLSWFRQDDNSPFVSVVENAAFVRFTSGTTGQSKGVVVSHKSVVERTATAQEALQLSEEDVVVWVLPMAYHFIVSIVMYVRYGITMAVCKDLFAKNIIETINVNQGSFLYAAPMHYQMLSKDSSGVTIPSLTRAISTSAGISEGTSLAFQERFALPVSQAYGIIEIGLPIINLGGTHARSVGYASPGLRVEILNDGGEVLPVDEVGHLVIQGPGIFDAYLNPACLREDVLQGGWFYTGDLASKNSAGLITVQGREKSMINVSGNKVFPEEVEEVLMLFTGVKLARVFGKIHPLMGEVVAAEVQVAGDDVDVKALRNHCRSHLSVYKIPQKITVVDKIELTGSGKVVRKAIQ